MLSQTCPHCGAPLRPGAKFCAKCGKPVTPAIQAPPPPPPAANPPPVAASQPMPVVPSAAPLICPRCQNPNRPGARHCARCGQALAPVAPLVKPAQPAATGIVWYKRRIFWVTVAAIALGLVVIVAAMAAVWPIVANSKTTPAASVTPTSAQAAPAAATAVLATQPAVATGVGTAAPAAASPTEVASATTPARSPTPELTLTPVVIPGLNIEIPHVTDAEEMEIGRQAAAEFESQNPLSRDAALIDRVRRIGAKIVPFQPRADIPFTFQVVDTDKINACALPGGHIYVNRGMMEYVQNDDELAGVIGHEIAHVALRHGAQQIEALAAAQAALKQNPDLAKIYQDQAAQIAVAMVAQVGAAGWGRQAELDADQYGTIYMAHAGYDPQAVVNLFQRFAAIEVRPNDPMAQLLATHPPFPDRIARVEETIRDEHLK